MIIKKKECQGVGEVSCVPWPDRKTQLSWK